MYFFSLANLFSKCKPFWGIWTNVLLDSNNEIWYNKFYIIIRKADVNNHRMTVVSQDYHRNQLLYWLVAVTSVCYLPCSIFY